MANMLCFFANDWGIYTLLTEGPNFLSNTLHKDVATVSNPAFKAPALIVVESLLFAQIGFLSSLPYLGRFTCAQIASAIGDYFVSRPHVSTKLSVRRVAYTVALLSPAIGLALLSYTTEKWYYCIAVMTVGTD